MEPLVNKITEGGKGTANAEKLFKQGEVPLDWEESQIAIATNNFGAYSGEKSPYPEIVKIFKNFLQYPDCKTAAGTMQCEKLAKYCLVQACSAKPKPDPKLKTCAAVLDKDASISTLPSQAAPAAHAAGTGTTASGEGGGSSCMAVLKSAFASAWRLSPVPKTDAFGTPTRAEALASQVKVAVEFAVSQANELSPGPGFALEMIKRSQKKLSKDLKVMGVKATFTKDMKKVDCEVIADGFEKDGSKGATCPAIIGSDFGRQWRLHPVPKTDAFGTPTRAEALASQVKVAVEFAVSQANELSPGPGFALEMIKRSQKKLSKDLKVMGVKATFTEDMKKVDCEVIADGFEKDGSSSGGESEGGNAFLDESSAGLRGSGTHHHRHHHHKHGRHYHGNRQHHDAAGSLRGLRFKGDAAVSAPSMPVAPLALVGEQASEMENAIKGLLIREGHGDCTKAMAMGRVSTEERHALLPPEFMCVLVLHCDTLTNTSFFGLSL
jgi:hypothetical protein